MSKNLIFSINGGLGKCIAATAVCSAIKKKYPEDKLIVISGYPEVFLNNPNVDKSFSFGNVSYFYQDYVENKENVVFLHDPYQTTAFIKEEKHLIEIWLEMFGLEYNGEFPEFYITKREIDTFQRQVQSDKPIMLLQTNGGADPNKKYSWARDLPFEVTAQIINEFKDKYTIFHIKRDDQIGFQDTVPLTAQLRQILAVSMLSSKRLVIDSFMQHALAALRMPSVACWIVNTPKVFGYGLHTHIMANPHTVKPELRNSFLSQFNIGGDELEFPYRNESEIFNVQDIINALNYEPQAEQPQQEQPQEQPKAEAITAVEVVEEKPLNKK
jgi:hypothetical protein